MTRREDITGTTKGTPGVSGERPRGEVNHTLDELEGACELRPVRSSREPMVYTRGALREMDRLAAEEFGIPTLVLMENAGAALAAHAKALLSFEPEDSGGGAMRALIVAGKGNNAGDGFVMARHFVNAGWIVGIVLAAPEAAYSGDAAVNLLICERMRIPRFVASNETSSAHETLVRASLSGGGDQPLRRVDLMVDALLGTGVRGAASGSVRDLIGALNEWRSETDAGRSRPQVLAVDIPSGLDADTGEPVDGGPVVRADLTVSLVGLKPGYSALGAQAYLGRVVVAEVGMPAQLLLRLGTASAPGGRLGDRADRTEAERRAYRPGE